MNPRSLTLLVAALGLGNAVASPPDQADADRDGFVTPQEHAADARRMFETMDADRDGRVNAAEMTASHGKVTGRPAQAGELSSAAKIAVIGADADGVLTAREHAEGAAAMFRRMDGDGDGRLTRAEIEAGHRAMLKQP